MISNIAYTPFLYIVEPDSPREAIELLEEGIASLSRLTLY